MEGGGGGGSAQIDPPQEKLASKSLGLIKVKNWNAHFMTIDKFATLLSYYLKVSFGLQKFNKMHKKDPGGRPTSKKLWNQWKWNDLQAFLTEN